MYLLTKKNVSELDLKEEVFNFLIKNNYSSEALLKYKAVYFNKIHNFSQSVDLGNNIRKLLAAITLRLINDGYKVVSKVSGWGNFEFLNSSFELFYCELILTLLKLSLDKKIYNFVKIKNNCLTVKIVYKDKASLLLKKRICFSINLKPSCDGKRYDFKDYYLNRLSAVSLALI